MYKFRLLVSHILLILAVTVYGIEDAKKLRPFSELIMRKGLANFFAKASSGHTLTVCYLGGSITEQAGWRVQSMEYFRKHFPKATFVENDATIGGTGSQLGVLRMDKDVLKMKPDLLFVEFAVNDNTTPVDITRRSMEGIVRKTWKLYPDCDICFVYTTSERLLSQNPSGYLNKAATTMEQVADFYGIPSVYLPADVISLLNAGTLVMKTPNGVMAAVAGKELDLAGKAMNETDGKIYFSPDGTHPYLNTGHKLYTQVLVRSFEKMERMKRVSAKHISGKAFSTDNFENSCALNWDSIQRQGTWNVVDMANKRFNKFSTRFDKIRRVMPGSTLDFSFKGSGLVAYDLLGPEGCTLEVTVDGKKNKLIRFDGYCISWRINNVVLATGLDTNMLHHVTIKVSDETPDKRKLLFERSWADLDKTPDKYKPTVWYVNSIFIL